MSEPEPEYVELKDKLIDQMALHEKLTLALFKSYFDHVKSRTFFSHNCKFKLECGLFEENGIIAVNFQNFKGLLNGTDHKFNNSNLKMLIEKIGYTRFFTRGSEFNKVKDMLSPDMSKRIDKKWLFYFENERHIPKIYYEDPVKKQIPINYPVMPELPSLIL